MRRVERLSGPRVEKAIDEWLPRGCGFLDKRLPTLFETLGAGPVVVRPGWIFWPRPAGATRPELLARTAFATDVYLGDAYFEVVLGEARDGFAVVTFRREEGGPGTFRTFDLTEPERAPREVASLGHLPESALERDSLRNGILRNGVETVTRREVEAAIDAWGAREAKACFEGCAAATDDGRWFAVGAGRTVAVTDAGRTFVERGARETLAACGRCGDERALDLSLEECLRSLLRGPGRARGWRCMCTTQI